MLTNEDLLKKFMGYGIDNDEDESGEWSDNQGWEPSSTPSGLSAEDMPNGPHLMMHDILAKFKNMNTLNNENDNNNENAIGNENIIEGENENNDDEWENTQEWDPPVQGQGLTAVDMPEHPYSRNEQKESYQRQREEIDEQYNQDKTDMGMTPKAAKNKRSENKRMLKRSQFLINDNDTDLTPYRERYQKDLETTSTKDAKYRWKQSKKWVIRNRFINANQLGRDGTMSDSEILGGMFLDPRNQKEADARAAWIADDQAFRARQTQKRERKALNKQYKREKKKYGRNMSNTAKENLARKYQGLFQTRMLDNTKQWMENPGNEQSDLAQNVINKWKDRPLPDNLTGEYEEKAREGRKKETLEEIARGRRSRDVKNMDKYSKKAEIYRKAGLSKYDRKEEKLGEKYLDKASAKARKWLANEKNKNDPRYITAQKNATDFLLARIQKQVGKGKLDKVEELSGNANQIINSGIKKEIRSVVAKKKMDKYTKGMDKLKKKSKRSIVKWNKKETKKFAKEKKRGKILQEKNAATRL